MNRKLTLRYLYPDKSLQNPYWGTKVFLVQTHTGSKRTQELLFEAVTAALRPLRQIFLHQIKWKSDKSSKIYSKLLKYKKTYFPLWLTSNNSEIQNMEKIFIKRPLRGSPDNWFVKSVLDVDYKGTWPRAEMNTLRFLAKVPITQIPTKWPRFLSKMAVSLHHDWGW